MNHSAHRRRRASTYVAAVLLVPVAGAAPSVAAADPVTVEDRTTITAADPLLDAPQRGRKAIRQLGDQLPVAAARNDLRPAELRSMLRSDRSVWVDPEGIALYVDPEPEVTAGGGEAPAPAVAPLSETFALHSNPGADLTILLDFDGAQVAGSAWNDNFGVTPGDHPAWDPAGDGAGFSDGERATIQQVWAMVAEDFAPFDVDVTTEDPGEAGLVRGSSEDTVYGTRVLVTPSDDPYLKICSRSCGGVAYLDVFEEVGSYYQPAWVFPQALGDDAKNVAEAASHEAGHNLRLQHDATSLEGYYAGHGVWAPIMGVGYYKPLAQWSQGSYPDATNQEDDLQILTGYLGARPDEASDSRATPSVLPAGEAVIGRPDDVDVYFLGTCAADTVVEVQPAAVAPNLDVRASLHDAAGTQQAVSQPVSSLVDWMNATGLGGSLTVPSSGDGWTLTVEGVGEGDWDSGGYDDYGSLGAYTVSAPGCDGELLDGVPSAPLDVAATSLGPESLTLTWAEPSAPGDGPVTGYVVSRSGSSTSQSLGAAARSHTFTGLAAGTTYQLSVRALNATGAGPSIVVSGTTEPPAALPPSAPRDVTGSYNQSTGVLQAWWTEPADSGTEPISGYTISVDGVHLDTLGSTSRGVDITREGGFGEGQYDVGVAAVNAVGSSPVATVTITVDRPDRPANDDIAAAETITGTSGSVAGDNAHATPEATDPAPPSAVTAGGYSVWYSWTPTSDGLVTLETTGGGLDRDTTLAAYTGDPGALVEVAGADDSVGFHARVAFDATAGTRYLIAVDGFSHAGGSGPFTLSWSQQVAGPPSAPTGVSALPGDGSATVSWAAADPNGSPVTGYSVTSVPGGHGCATTGGLSCTVSGLSNGTAYAFTVVARNAVGESPESVASAPVTPRAAATAPSKMRPPKVVVRGRKAIVTWKAASPNGSPVTRYLVDISKGKDKSARGGSRKVVFKGLKPGRYKFRVAARNAVGTSPYSRPVRVRIRR